LTIKAKTQIIVALTMLLTVSVIYVTSQIVFQRGFAGVERQDTQNEITRALNALNQEYSELEADAADYAVWDDTVVFLQDRSQRYIDANLVDNFYTTFGVDFAVFLDTQGQIVYAAGYDLNGKKAEPLPDGLTQELTPTSSLVRFDSPSTKASGLLMLPQGPVLVASRPIVTSDGKGPVRGALVLGRVLDSVAVQTLARQTLQTLDILPAAASTLPADFKTALGSLSNIQPLFVKPLGEEAIGGYALLKDIHGQPALVLRVSVPRTAYMQGQTSTAYFLVALAIVVLLFGLLVNRLLERSVFSRLSRLVKELRPDGSSPSAHTRVSAEGKDEIATLATTINSSFSELESYQRQLAERGDRLVYALGEVEQRHAELEASHKRLRRLEEVSAWLGSNLDLDEALARVGTAPLEIFGADSMWLLTASAEAPQLQGKAVVARLPAMSTALPALFGVDEATALLSLKNGSHLLTRAYATKQPEFIEDLAKIDRDKLSVLLGSETYELAGVRALAVIPLVADDEISGLMVLARNDPEGFTSDEGAAALVLANHLALAVKNTNLFTEVKRHSEHDSLTGVYNHRMLHVLLEQEMSRARRFGGTFSLVMVDVDGFKLLNDTYGHPAGDRVLQQVARLFSDKTRSADLVGRYGGDEFLLILPETNGEGAAKVASHLRSAVASYPFPSPEGLAVPIRLSFGISTYPENGQDGRQLLTYADERLYDSKRRGGNTVTRKKSPKAYEEHRPGAFNVLDGLVTAVDNKDGYTRLHSDEVARYAGMIARELGLPEEVQRKLNLAALLHDVGKIGVPDEILRKPARLTASEFDIVRQHAVLGAMIVQQLPEADEIRSAVVSHHESLDGRGYPQGLMGEEIPLLGRILAVADAYSAMTTDRPYRRAFPKERAAEELRAAAGVHFDPEIVRVFLSLLPTEAEPAEPPESGQPPRFTSS
jgi:diguanylate cyclase (GGDEF)-like protein/putative nucleotidyltransferase with HDIG domain